MRAANLPSEAQRSSIVGLTYVEVLSGASGTFEAPRGTAIRVRAAAGLTVTIEGVLAATMISGEIIIFNSGDPMPGTGKNTCTFAVSGNAYVQVGREQLLSTQYPRYS